MAHSACPLPTLLAALQQQRQCSLLPLGGWAVGCRLKEEKNTPLCITHTSPVTHKPTARCHYEWYLILLYRRFANKRLH